MSKQLLAFLDVSGVLMKSLLFFSAVPTSSSEHRTFDWVIVPAHLKMRAGKS